MKNIAAKQYEPSKRITNNKIIAQLNRAYLRAIITAWNSQDFEVIQSLGVTNELARRLANAPYSAVDFLGSFRDAIANFTGDPMLIERLLDHNIRELETQQKIDELLALGATFEFLNALTGLHHEVLSKRARALGVIPVGSRPTLLNPEEWERAHAAWCDAQKMSPIDRWIHVARKTQILIRRLHAAFRKYDYLDSDGM